MGLKEELDDLMDDLSERVASWAAARQAVGELNAFFLNHTYGAAPVELCERVTDRTKSLLALLTHE